MRQNEMRRGQETGDKNRDENRYKTRDELLLASSCLFCREYIVVMPCGGQLLVKRIGVW
jgi:hypothetical protein